MTTTLNVERLDLIQEALNELDFFVVWQDDPEADEADGVWYPDYSGRGMYGETCLGVTVANPANFMLMLGWALGKLDEENAWVTDLSADLFDHVSQDSMGRQAIVYFPRVQMDMEEVADRESD